MITVAIDLPVIAMSQEKYDELKAQVLWYQSMPNSLCEVVGDSFSDSIYEVFAEAFADAVTEMDERLTHSFMTVNDEGQLVASLYVDEGEGEYQDVVITII